MGIGITRAYTTSCRELQPPARAVASLFVTGTRRDQLQTWKRQPELRTSPSDRITNASDDPAPTTNSDSVFAVFGPDTLPAFRSILSEVLLELLNEIKRHR